MSEHIKKDLKTFLKHWMPLFIFTGIVMVLFVIFYISRKQDREEVLNSYYESPNTERVYGDKRVFDFANQLTDSEEVQLEEYIHAKEKVTLTDIVIVTLNESLADFEPEYRAKYTEQITPDKYVMVYAEKFWEDNRFGYDAPHVLDGTTATGDGVILVDNIFREPETSKIYTWMCTVGIVEDTFSSAMIDSTLSDFYMHVNDDYYQACIDFIDTYAYYMDSEKSIPRLGHFVPYIIAVIILIAYVLQNRKEKMGFTTTKFDTYLIGNSLEFTENRDVFIKKDVTRKYSPPSSSSGSSGGGGGHHISGGGGSYGGGGRSR